VQSREVSELFPQTSNFVQSKASAFVNEAFNIQTLIIKDSSGFRQFSDRLSSRQIYPLCSTPISKVAERQVVTLRREHVFHQGIDTKQPKRVSQLVETLPFCHSEENEEEEGCSTYMDTVVALRVPLQAPSARIKQ